MKVSIEYKREIAEFAAVGYALLTTGIILLVLAAALSSVLLTMLFTVTITASVFLIACHEWLNRTCRLEFARLKTKDAADEYLAALREEKRLIAERVDVLDDVERFMNGEML